MHIFTQKEYKNLESILKMKENDLYNLLYKVLKKSNYTPIKGDGYIIAEGDIPIALAAHIDTVFSIPPTELFYDKEQNVMWAPGGAGFDDRAGIYMIIKLLRAGFHPHIIFSQGEEKGGIGAVKLIKDYPSSPFKDLKYIIQLDRRGMDDCVFYQCDNQDFIDYVEDFGFIEALGSFTDISIYCPAWKVAGVNLSIGYRDEHTSSEVLFVNGFYSTAKKVSKMLKSANDSQYYKYVPMKFPYNFWMYPTDEDSFDEIDMPYYDSYSKIEPTYLCCKCNKSYPADYAFAISTGINQKQYVCYNCLDDSYEWCARCGEPFKKTKDNDILCKECLNISDAK